MGKRACFNSYSNNVDSVHFRMKLSKKGEYALRSLINLGIASEMKRKLVQVSELAENEQLPVKFLEQILQALKEGGIVASQRGKFGGYRLARPARKIFIGEVVGRALRLPPVVPPPTSLASSTGRPRSLPLPIYLLKYADVCLPSFLVF